MNQKNYVAVVEEALQELVESDQQSVGYDGMVFVLAKKEAGSS